MAIPVSEITSGEFTAERADKYQGVKAKWHSVEDASLHFVTVGKGEPYDELKDEYDSEEARGWRRKTASMKCAARRARRKFPRLRKWRCARKVSSKSRARATRSPPANGAWKRQSFHAMLPGFA